MLRQGRQLGEEGNVAPVLKQGRQLGDLGETEGESSRALLLVGRPVKGSGVAENHVAKSKQVSRVSDSDTLETCLDLGRWLPRTQTE